MQQRLAKYDENGDIILSLTEVKSSSVPIEPIEEAEEPEMPARPSVVRRTTGKILEEGSRQWKASMDDAVVLPKRFNQELKGGLKSFWHALQQPVWVPSRRGKAKKYTRGTLFLFDTVRFGATFASVFGVLFLSLNYQSFFSIIQASVDPLAAASAGDELQSEISDAPSSGTGTTVATPPQNDNKSLLDMLPPVGPPDNRLIIPKLNLNVPIVTPSQDDLINQDWKALENDIQTALQSGVVYYPGTAKPGQAGNFFLTGHSSYYPWSPGKFKSVFARLSELSAGDEYYVYFNGDKHRYKILGEKVVEPSDTSVLDQPTDQRIATMMTCTPVGTALHRLIVSAVEVDENGNPLKVGEHDQQDNGSQKVQMQLLPI